MLFGVTYPIFRLIKTTEVDIYRAADLKGYSYLVVCLHLHDVHLAVGSVACEDYLRWCIFLQQYRIHMDIGNSKNYLGIV